MKAFPSILLSRFIGVAKFKGILHVASSVLAVKGGRTKTYPKPVLEAKGWSGQTFPLILGCKNHAGFSGQKAV